MDTASRVATCPTGPTQVGQDEWIWGALGYRAIRIEHPVSLMLTRQTSAQELIAALGEPDGNDSKTPKGSYRWGKFEALDDSQRPVTVFVLTAGFSNDGLERYQKLRPVYVEGATLHVVPDFFLSVGCRGKGFSHD